jgi:GMP synthase (glutamine-hydrolysing)
MEFHVEADPRSLEQWFVGRSVELPRPAFASPTCGPQPPRSRTDRAQAQQIFATWLGQIVQFVDRAAATSTGSTR